MDPASPRAAPIALLDHVDEGGHVVVGDPLALGDRGHEARRRPSGPGPGPPAASAAGTTPTAAKPSTASSSTSSQRAKPGLVAEEGGHVGRAVAGDHGRPPSDAGRRTVAARSAMSVR